MRTATLETPETYIETYETLDIAELRHRINRWVDDVCGLEKQHGPKESIRELRERITDSTKVHNYRANLLGIF